MDQEVWNQGVQEYDPGNNSVKLKVKIGNILCEKGARSSEWEGHEKMTLKGKHKPVPRDFKNKSF
jgi:hypothetical protein